MSFPYGAESLAPGAGYRIGNPSTASGSSSLSLYPNPFFDIAQSYMPADPRAMYRWYRFYAMANPLVATALFKVSSYPITDVIYETTNPGVKELWRHLYEDVFQIRSFVVESNLDCNTFGISYTSVLFPFEKRLTCPKCADTWLARTRPYRFRSCEFHAACKKCLFSGAMLARDDYASCRSVAGIRLMRWNPEHVDSVQNPVTGACTYAFRLPKSVRNAITMGVADVVEKTPQPFIEAVKKNKKIILHPDQVFVSKRPSISRDDAGVGMSRLLPVLKHLFYLQVMMKAQEATMVGFFNPLRVLFPQAVPGMNPYTHMDLADWRSKISGEIRAHRRDPNHVAVLPLPMGYQSIGGEGKALLLTQEMRMWSEIIVSGMGIPQELVFGGASWSGSNVSLRMLENEFLATREDNLALLRFIRDKVSAWLGWPSIEMRFRPFKMADDLQRSAFSFQLVQAKLLSKRSVLEQLDFDYDDEKERVGVELRHELELQRKQQLFSAETQGQMMLVQSRYQMQAQEIMGQGQPQVGPDGQPIDPNAQPADPNAQAAQQPQAPQGRPSMGPGGIVEQLQSPMSLQNVSRVMPADGPDAFNRAAAGEGGVDMNAAAESIASQINAMDEFNKASAMAQARTLYPELWPTILQAMNPMQPGQPMPEQKPPRRGPGTAQI